mgnify:CR=1 FL=1
MMYFVELRRSGETVFVDWPSPLPDSPCSGKRIGKKSASVLMLDFNPCIKLYTYIFVINLLTIYPIFIRKSCIKYIVLVACC